MASDLALTARNPKTGRFGFAWDPKTKDVVFDESEMHAVMSQLTSARAQWWADTTGTQGSDIKKITHITASTTSDAIAYARQALQPLVDQKRITVNDVQTSTTTAPVGRLTVSVSYTPRGGQQITVTVSF